MCLRVRAQPARTGFPCCSLAGNGGRTFALSAGISRPAGMIEPCWVLGLLSSLRVFRKMSPCLRHIVVGSDTILNSEAVCRVLRSGHLEVEGVWRTMHILIVSTSL